jgi:hypothetical protein
MKGYSIGDADPIISFPYVAQLLGIRAAAIFFSKLS